LQLLLVFVVCVALVVPSRAWLFSKDDGDDIEEQFDYEDYKRLREFMPDMPTCDENCDSDHEFCVMFGCLEPHGKGRKEWCVRSCAYLRDQCRAECKEKGFMLY